MRATATPSSGPCGGGHRQPCHATESLLANLQVATDIVITGEICDEEEVSDSVHTAEDVIRRLSISILCFFVLEWIIEVCPVPTSNLSLQ